MNRRQLLAWWCYWRYWRRRWAAVRDGVLVGHGAVAVWCRWYSNSMCQMWVKIRWAHPDCKRAKSRVTMRSSRIWRPITIAILYSKMTRAPAPIVSCLKWVWFYFMLLQYFFFWFLFLLQSVLQCVIQNAMNYKNNEIWYSRRIIS